MSTETVSVYSWKLRNQLLWYFFFFNTVNRFEFSRLMWQAPYSLSRWRLLILQSALPLLFASLFLSGFYISAAWMTDSFEIVCLHITFTNFPLKKGDQLFLLAFMTINWFNNTSTNVFFQSFPFRKHLVSCTSVYTFFRLKYKSVYPLHFPKRRNKWGNHDV